MNLKTVEEYAKTRIGWRGHPVNPSYIYKLIKQVRNGQKTETEVGFKIVEKGKRYFIQP